MVHALWESTCMIFGDDSEYKWKNEATKQGR